MRVALLVLVCAAPSCILYTQEWVVASMCIVGVVLIGAVCLLWWACRKRTEKDKQAPYIIVMVDEEKDGQPPTRRSSSSRPPEGVPAADDGVSIGGRGVSRGASRDAVARARTPSAPAVGSAVTTRRVASRARPPPAALAATTAGTVAANVGSSAMGQRRATAAKGLAGRADARSARGEIRDLDAVAIIEEEGGDDDDEDVEGATDMGSDWRAQGGAQSRSNAAGAVGSPAVSPSAAVLPTRNPPVGIPAPGSAVQRFRRASLGATATGHNDPETLLVASAEQRSEAGRRQMAEQHPLGIASFCVTQPADVGSSAVLGGAEPASVQHAQLQMRSSVANFREAAQAAVAAKRLAPGNISAHDATEAIAALTSGRSRRESAPARTGPASTLHANAWGSSLGLVQAAGAAGSGGASAVYEAPRADTASQRRSGRLSSVAKSVVFVNRLQRPEVSGASLEADFDLGLQTPMPPAAATLKPSAVDAELDALLSATGIDADTIATAVTSADAALGLLPPSVARTSAPPSPAPRSMGVPRHSMLRIPAQQQQMPQAPLTATGIGPRRPSQVALDAFVGLPSTARGDGGIEGGWGFGAANSNPRRAGGDAAAAPPSVSDAYSGGSSVPGVQLARKRSSLTTVASSLMMVGQASRPGGMLGSQMNLVSSGGSPMLRPAPIEPVILSSRRKSAGDAPAPVSYAAAGMGGPRRSMMLAAPQPSPSGASQLQQPLSRIGELPIPVALAGRRGGDAAGGHRRSFLLPHDSWVADT
jgi:hypothetical protein